MRKIIGIGETVFDIIFRNGQPTAGVPGGSTFNALISLGRTLGVRYPDLPILMITETGDDHIGDVIVDFMRRNHVSTAGVTRNANTQSHISLAFLNDRNDAQYEFYKDHANARLNADKVARIGFASDDVVLFGSFFAINPAIRDYTRSLLTAAHQAGSILYYDINFRQSHVKDIPDVMDNITENYRLSDIVRGSAEDFGYLYGTTDAAEVYERYIRKHCPNFICTNGGSSIEVFCPAGHFSFKVPRVRTVSTIGAGDNFNAGIVFALVRYCFFKNGSLKPISLNEAAWNLLVQRTAKKFSANVCRSIYNYVDEDFVNKL
ncbi:MAG: carbohydrate kinase [Bacteroidales bacterium]|nr:carbohydrate kinase [Candidatus Liminaster caballi]